MDLGGDESAAWAGGYTFWSEGDEGEGRNEVYECKAGENGLCEYFQLHSKH